MNLRELRKAEVKAQQELQSLRELIENKENEKYVKRRSKFIGKTFVKDNEFYHILGLDPEQTGVLNVMVLVPQKEKIHGVASFYLTFDHDYPQGSLIEMQDNREVGEKQFTAEITQLIQTLQTIADRIG